MKLDFFIYKTHDMNLPTSVEVFTTMTVKTIFTLLDFLELKKTINYECFTDLDRLEFFNDRLL